LSIIKLGRDNFERFSVIARPRRTFSSSSAGITGSVSVFARSSNIEKDIEKQVFTDSEFTSDDPESIRLATIALSGTSNLSGEVDSYMKGVNSLTKSAFLFRFNIYFWYNKSIKFFSPEIVLRFQIRFQFSIL
jgi:hypothetical protein